MLVYLQRTWNLCNRSWIFRLFTLGVWVLVCLSLYDRVNPHLNNVLTIGETVGRVAQDMLIYQNAPPPKVIHRPFDPQEPKVALILGYQRCGSTFTGNIFNQNPEAFYLFEPVDGIYGAMYGASPGFSVPSDIANYWNGSERVIPEIEAYSVAEVMSSLLSCDFKHVPTEVLLHRFMYLFKAQQGRLAHYTECLRSHDLNIPKCRRSINELCVQRFGGDTEKQDYCRYMLWEQREDGAPNTDPSRDRQASFDRYQHCMGEQRRTMGQCLPEMQQLCESSALRTTKTVRLNMRSAEIMFKHLHNFRVIHLIRDPRAVVLSRLGDSTYHGHFSGSSLTKEASLYCRGVLNDVRIRKRIEDRFPGSVLQVIYEHFVANPMAQVDAIYSFLDEPVPEEVHQWLVKNTAGEIKNSTHIAEKWQDKMSFKMARLINEACAELFEAIGYTWPTAA